VRFWDSSAIVPFLLIESVSDAVRVVLRTDPSMVVWWGTPVECASAIARAERDSRVDRAGVADALAGLRLLRSGWGEIDATARLREIAERLVRVHPMRAADAMQLAAATVATGGRPDDLAFVTLDDQLALAAEREGFPVIRPGQG
jgi:uncharacterized protein